MQMLYDEGQARRFLAAALPWPADTLDGVVNLVARAPSKDPKKPYWNHIGVKDVDEAVKAITYLGKKGGTDVYSWMGLGRPNAKPLPTKSKFPSLWFKGNRLAENAAWFKSIFIDVDAGPKKGYKTLPEVLRALADFLAKAALPQPNIIVCSGHGFHLHWTLTEAIPVERWSALSHRLVSAIKLHGLICDTSCTIDLARILRVPGTWNNKDPKAPLKVRLLRLEPPFFEEALVKALAPYPPATVVAHGRASGMLVEGADMPVRPAVGLEGSMAEGIIHEPLPIDIDAVAVHCPLIRDALATGGAEHANPLWHQMVYLSTFMLEGDDVAHWLGHQHPDYTPEETEAEYARALKTRQSHPELGWTKCVTLHETGSAFCAGCPHLQEGKSPLNFGITLESKVELPEDSIEAQVVDLLPPLFQRNPVTKYVYFEEAQEEGGMIPRNVGPYPILNGFLSGSEDDMQLNFSAIYPNNQINRIKLPTKYIRSTRMRETLQGFSFMPGEKAELDLLSAFMSPWVDLLYQSQQHNFIGQPVFGWLDRDGKISGFTYAGETWSPKGRSPAPRIPTGLNGQYEPAGTLAPWQDAAQLVINRRQAELDTILATAFAAPLVRFTGERGLQLYPWSQGSGVGKTTALRVAAAVWGHPVASMQATNDTENSVLQKMKDIRNLPVYWDEIRTQEDINRFVNLVFNQAGGKNKSRLKSDASYQTVGTWQTLMVCCSNVPLLEAIQDMTKATNAGMLRVIEYEIGSSPDPAGIVPSGEADAVFNRLNENYGIVGRSYAQWLGQNFHRLEKDIRELNNHVETWLTLDPSERFWRDLLVVLALGARYASELDFALLDEAAITSFVANQINRSRGIVDNAPNDLNNVRNLVDILTNFRAAMMERRTIRVEQLWSRPGRVPHNFYKTNYVVNKFDRLDVVESEKDDLLRFSYKTFEDWLRERCHYPMPRLVIKNLEERLSAKLEYQRCLLPGHAKDPGKQSYIEVSLSRLV